MIPVFKVFALMTRVFTRPLIMYIKSYHKNNKALAQSFMARPFIFLGNCQYHASMYLNRKLLKVETDEDMFVKPLNVEIAMETGMELFYEIAVYALVIGICIYEVRKYNIEGQLSKQTDKDHLDRIQKKLDDWMAKQIEQERKIEFIRQKVAESNKGIVAGDSVVSRLFWHNQFENKVPASEQV